LLSKAARLNEQIKSANDRLAQKADEDLADGRSALDGKKLRKKSLDMNRRFTESFMIHQFVYSESEFSLVV